MKNEHLGQRLRQEFLGFIDSCQTLMLASQGADGGPYASYAPFAIGQHCLCVLISEIAVHARNLAAHTDLIVERAATARDAAAGVDILTTATADKTHATIVDASMLSPGLHINAVGGD